MSRNLPIIGFAGMTHLGLVSGAGAAEKGFNVVGYDADPGRIDTLKKGRLPVVEPGLDELVSSNAARLRFTADVNDMARCDIVFVAYDVPTDDQGRSDLGPIRDLLDRIGPVLAPHCLLTVMCQVPPGFTRTLTRDPDRTYYLVETLIFGQAVQRTLCPERFILGQAEAGRELPEALRVYLGAYGCPILPMRYESAELAKISINMFLVASVTTSNTLAELCEAVGADWSEIAPTLRLDKRIGPHAYLAPGLGIAGGNLERDLATVIRLGDELGTEVGTVRAWQHNSRHRKNWVLRTLGETILSETARPRIAMLGLAYKKDTNSVKNSPAVETLAGLAPFPVAAYDPVVKVDPTWHPDCVQAFDAVEACRGVDVVVVMTPWDEFSALDVSALRQAMTGNIVIDPYGVLNREAAVEAGLRYYNLGAAATA